MNGEKLILLFLIFVSGLNSLGFDFIVAKDGSGDFKTVQKTISAVPDFRKNRTVIFIKPGIYKEKLILPTSKTNVTFIGENVEKTILTFDDFASKKNRFGEEMGTTGSSSFFIFGDGFTAENLTFGWSTAFFDDCTIFCKDNGYITAPSTNENTPFGFVFLNCQITGNAPAASFYLGRPWRPFGKSVFIHCEMGPHIKPEGWHNWNKPDAEKTAFFTEYNNTGSGSKGPRGAWSHQLSDEEVPVYIPENILGEWVLNPQLFNNEIKNKK